MTPKTKTEIGTRLLNGYGWLLERRLVVPQGWVSKVMNWVAWWSGGTPLFQVVKAEREHQARAKVILDEYKATGVWPST